MDAEILFQLIGVILTIAGAVASVIYSQRARRDTQLQRDLELLGVEQEYYRDLRQWADRVIASMTEAIFIVMLDKTARKSEGYEARWSLCQRDLSALIEQGRLFLPNEERSTFGTEKLPAYRGFRSPILNPLVQSYRALDTVAPGWGEGSTSEVKEVLWKLRQEFVSHIQKLLDPRAQRAAFDAVRRGGVTPDTITRTKG